MAKISLIRTDLSETTKATTDISAIVQVSHRRVAACQSEVLEVRISYAARALHSVRTASIIVYINSITYDYYLFLL